MSFETSSFSSDFAVNLRKVREYNRLQKQKLQRQNPRRKSNGVSITGSVAERAQQLYEDGLDLCLKLFFVPSIDAPLAQQQQEREQHTLRVVKAFEDWSYHVSLLTTTTSQAEKEVAFALGNADKHSLQSFKKEGILSSIFFLRMLWEWSCARSREDHEKQRREGIDRQSEQNTGVAPSLAAPLPGDVSSTSNKEELLINSMIESIQLVYRAMIALGYFDPEVSRNKNLTSHSRSRKGFYWITNPLIDKDSALKGNDHDVPALCLNEIISKWHSMVFNEDNDGNENDPAPAKKRSRTSLTPLQPKRASNESIDNNEKSMCKKAIVSLPWILMLRTFQASEKRSDSAALQSQNSPETSSGGMFRNLFSGVKRKLTPTKKEEEAVQHPSNTEQAKRKCDAEVFYILLFANMLHHSDRSQSIMWTELTAQSEQLSKMLPKSKSWNISNFGNLSLACFGLDLLAMCRTEQRELILNLETKFQGREMQRALPWKLPIFDGGDSSSESVFMVYGLDYGIISKLILKQNVLYSLRCLSYPEEFPFAVRNSAPTIVASIFPLYETLTLLNVLKCFVNASTDCAVKSSRAALHLLSTSRGDLDDDTYILNRYRTENNFIPAPQSSLVSTSLWGRKESTNNEGNSAWSDVDKSLLRQFINIKVILLLKARHYEKACTLCNRVEDAFGGSSTFCCNCWDHFFTYTLDHLSEVEGLDCALTSFAELLSGMEIKEKGIVTMKSKLYDIIENSSSPEIVPICQKVLYDILKPRRGQAAAYAAAFNDSVWNVQLAAVSELDKPSNGILWYGERILNAANDIYSLDEAEPLALPLEESISKESPKQSPKEKERDDAISAVETTEEKGHCQVTTSDTLTAKAAIETVSSPESSARTEPIRDSKRNRSPSSSPIPAKKARKEEVEVFEIVDSPEPPDRKESNLSKLGDSLKATEKQPSPNAKDESNNEFTKLDDKDKKGSDESAASNGEDQDDGDDDQDDGDDDRGDGTAIRAADASPSKSIKNRRYDVNSAPLHESDSEIEIIDSSDDEADVARAMASSRRQSSKRKDDSSVEVHSDDDTPNVHEGQEEEEEEKASDDYDNEVDYDLEEDGAEENDETQEIIDVDDDEYDSDDGMHVQESVSSSDAHDADQSSEGETQASSDSDSGMGDEAAAASGHKQDNDDIIELDSDGEEVQAEQTSASSGSHQRPSDASDSDKSKGCSSPSRREQGDFGSLEEPPTPISSRNREAAAWSKPRSQGAPGLDSQAHVQSSGHGSVGLANASRELIPFGDETDFTDRATADHVSSEEDEAPIEVKIEGPSSDVGDARDGRHQTSGASSQGSDANKDSSGSAGGDDDDDATARFKTEARPGSAGIPSEFSNHQNGSVHENPPEEHLPRRAASVAASDRATADHVSSDSDDAAPLEVRIDANVHSKEHKAKEDRRDSSIEDENMSGGLSHRPPDRARFDDVAQLSPNREDGRRMPSEAGGRSSILRSVFKSEASSRPKEHHVHMEYDASSSQPDGNQREQQDERLSELGDHTERPTGGWASTVASDRATADHVSTDEDEAPLEISAPPVVKASHQRAASGAPDGGNHPALGVAAQESNEQPHLHQPTSMVEEHANPQDEGDHAGPVVQAASTVASDRATADHVSSDSEDEAPIVVHIDRTGATVADGERDGRSGSALPSHRAVDGSNSNSGPREQGVALPPEVHDAPIPGHAGSTIGSDRATADHASESEDDAPLEVHIGGAPGVPELAKASGEMKRSAVDVNAAHTSKVGDGNENTGGPGPLQNAPKEAIEETDNPPVGVGPGASTVASDRATADTDVSSDDEDAPIEVHINPAPVDDSSATKRRSPSPPSAHQVTSTIAVGSREAPTIQPSHQPQDEEDDQLAPDPLGLMGAASTTLSDRATADASSSEDEAPLEVHIDPSAGGPVGIHNGEVVGRRPRDSTINEGTEDVDRMREPSHRETSIPIPPPPLPAGLGASTVASDRATADHVSSDEDEAPIEVHIGDGDTASRASGAEMSGKDSATDDQRSAVDTADEMENLTSNERREGETDQRERRTNEEDKDDQPHLMGGGDTVATDRAMADHVSSDEDEAPIEVRIDPSKSRIKPSSEDVKQGKDPEKVIGFTSEDDRIEGDLTTDHKASDNAGEMTVSGMNTNTASALEKSTFMDEAQYPEKGDPPKGTDTVATDRAIADHMTSDEEDAPIEIRVAAENDAAKGDSSKASKDVNNTSPDNADMPPPNSVPQPDLKATDPRDGPSTHDPDNKLDRSSDVMSIDETMEERDATAMGVDEEAEETDLAVADDDSISASEDDAPMEVQVQGVEEPSGIGRGRGSHSFAQNPAPLNQFIKPIPRPQVDDLDDAETMTTSNLTDVAVAGRSDREDGPAPMDVEPAIEAASGNKKSSQSDNEAETTDSSRAVTKGAENEDALEAGDRERFEDSGQNEVSEDNRDALTDSDLIELRMERGSFVSDRAIADNKSDFTDDEAPVEVHIRPEEDEDGNLLSGDLSSDDDDKSSDDDGTSKEHKTTRKKHAMMSKEGTVVNGSHDDAVEKDEDAVKLASDDANGASESSPHERQGISATSTTLPTVMEDEALESTEHNHSSLSGQRSGHDGGGSETLLAMKDVVGEKDTKAEEASFTGAPPVEDKPFDKQRNKRGEANKGKKKGDKDSEDDISVASGSSTRSSRRLKEKAKVASTEAEGEMTEDSRGTRFTRRARLNKSVIQNKQLPPRPKKVPPVISELDGESTQGVESASVSGRARSNSDVSEMSEMSTSSQKGRKGSTRSKKTGRSKGEIVQVPVSAFPSPRRSTRGSGASVTSDHTGKSRGSKLGCGCRTGCKTMRCSCRKNGHVCTADCGCQGLCEGNANPEIVQANAKPGV